MRAFIAIELPQNIKDYLGRLQNQIKRSGADVKWIEAKNIHLTLKFLGEVEDEKLDKIFRILDTLASLKSQFYLRVASLGTFPNINSPRVIWVGLDKGDQETQEIAEALEEETTGLGIPKENRPFSSHITIGRIKSGLNRIKLVQGLNELKDKAVGENLALHKTSAGQSANHCGGLEFLVTKITLFKSTLTPKGPIYEIFKEANLKAT